MSDDILPGQVQEGDSIDAVEDPLHLEKARVLPAREVDLGFVPRNNNPGVQAEPGQEHFHLEGCGVLGLAAGAKKSAISGNGGLRRSLVWQRDGKTTQSTEHTITSMHNTPHFFTEYFNVLIQRLN